MTVVFVDVEGSTALLQRVGDETGLASVRRQLDVVRERVEPYGGNEVKSLGDGLLATFSSPRQAVFFALASQRALADSTPRVRFGINTGEVLGADTDPLGGAVNAASRIAGRAVGGEVLVSDVVRQLVGMAPAIRFEDRGRCRLKGFAERWHLWAAVDGAAEQRRPATIGRDTELQSLADFVSTTAAGVGRVVLVEGEAGIGKTHLVRETTAQARSAGIGVVEVTADEVVRRPGVIPHGLLRSAGAGGAPRARLDELLNAPRDRGEGGEDLGYAILEMSVDLLEELARTRPLLLVTEDLQWADELSIGVLAAIIQRAGASRFSVLGSLRPTPRPAALDRLVERIADGLGSHVRLGALDDVDVHTLASALTGAAPGHGLRQRLRATAGNPLFVTELLRSLDEEGLLRIESGVADVTPGVVPANLHATLVRRLSWLPTETNELLRLASLLGNTFTLQDLAAITGRPVIDIAAWLRDASLAGLIVGDGDRLTFRHDLIREAVYGHMLPAERRDLHRAAGQALAQNGAPTQQIAQQFARGALPGDLEAITWLERAALETIYVSPASAIALFDEALSLAPERWPRRAALQAQMIEPLAICGRYDDAQQIAETILTAAPSNDVEYIVLRALSAVHAGRGDIGAEIASLHRAAAAPAAPADEARRQRCIAARLATLIGSMPVEDGQQVAQDTLAQALADHDATTQCVAHQTLGVLASVTGYGNVAREHLERALALFESGQVIPAAYQNTESFLAPCLLELDAVDEARVTAEKACRQAERRGALTLLPMTYLVVAGAHIYAGRWDDALAQLETGLAVSADIGNLNYVLYYEAAVAILATHRGDLETARARLSAGIQRFNDDVARYGAEALFGAQAEFLAAEGDFDAALTVAQTTWEHTAPIRYIRGYRQRGAFLVRLAIRLGREDLARSVTSDLEEGARRTPALSAAAAALHCRGLLDKNPDLLLDAVARYRDTPLRPAFAACCEDAAGLFAANTRRDEAVTLLREAAAIYDDINAAADSARVADALRALGVRRHHPAPRRPSFGWESLTPMETNVSRLVAEGLTNPEIGAQLYISRRTVETHISHVFRKLGLASRTQLAAELSRRSSVP
jgi:DNA-binding CsgD family transcriptional regulator